MPGWLGVDADPISKGWGPAPQLQAPNISGLVSAILENRLTRDKMTQGNIADTIKQLQEQRQSQAYLEAAQQAGLLEGVDTEKLGALGIRGASDLAEQIRKKQDADSLEAYRGDKLAARISSSGGGRGGGGGGGDAGGGELNIKYDPYGNPYVVGPRGGVKAITRGTGTSGGAAGPKPQTQDQVMREQARLLEEKDAMDQEIATQRAANEKALKPNVPYTRQGEYNRTVNRLKQLQQLPGMPTTDVPGAISTPRVTDDTGADTGAVVPPLLARPDVSKGAPVNLPQVGDQRPGPNGTTIEWDGHGWKIVG